MQRQAEGPSKTTGSEQWPAKMCQWLSALLLSSCSHSAKDAVGREISAKPDDEMLKDSFPINEPEGPRVLGGTPVVDSSHDGGGLCSPGNWPHHARS